MPTLHSHGAGHTHLRLSLRSEHDEDQEDEKDARRDGEESEHHEDGCKGVAYQFGLIQVLLLSQLNLDCRIF